MTSSTGLLRTAPHEFDARLIYHDHGLDPWFAFLSAISREGGSGERTVTIDGDEIQATLYYQESGIEDLDHPDVDVDVIREPRISWSVVGDEDDPGELSGNFHVRPRTPGMKDGRGRPIQIGRVLGIVGLDIRAQGSNLAFDRYPELFVELAAAFGINRRYFQELDEQRSRVVDAARYVRIDRDLAGPIHAPDGVISRIAHLLASDRSGYRKHVADDRLEPGFYHSATVGPDRAAELVDGHRFAKEIKHYLPRQPEAFDPDDPLYHPKVEASFQSKQNGGPSGRNHDRAVRWEHVDELDRELDEIVLNVLRWEGFPVEDEYRAARSQDEDGQAPSRFGTNGAGPGLHADLNDVYVEDAYFRLGTSRRRRVLVPMDPTPRLKDRQESVVIRSLARMGKLDDTPEGAVVGKLATDGGAPAPADVADDSGYHLSTIYRAIGNLQELVEHTYGSVSFRSPWIAEQLTQAVQHAEDAALSAGRIAEGALELAGDLKGSSLIKWLRANDVDVDSVDDGRMFLRFGGASTFTSTSELRDVLATGLDAWIAAGRDRSRFRNAVVKARVGGRPAVLEAALPADLAPA